MTGEDSGPPGGVAPAAGLRGGFQVIAIARDDIEYRAARDLRYSTLYAPWDLPRVLVEDTDGRTYEHFVAVDGAGAVVGYARLHLEDGEAKVFQVCVDESWRGHGVGRALMEAVAGRARAEGRESIELDARETALAFYDRLGYAQEGDTFLSERTGTPHRRMRRAL